jgi:hypothetical protein
MGGATTIKIEIKDLHPTQKQLKLHEKLMKGPTMTRKQIKDFEKINKWMGKWKV